MQFLVPCYDLMRVRRRLDVGAESLSDLAGSVQESNPYSHAVCFSSLDSYCLNRADSFLPALIGQLIASAIALCA